MSQAFDHKLYVQTKKMMLHTIVMKIHATRIHSHLCTLAMTCTLAALAAKRKELRISPDWSLPVCICMRKKRIKSKNRLDRHLII